MGMLSDENSNRGKSGPSASKNSSLSAGASKSGSTGKASVGGGKASNPASKTSSASASSGARTSSTGGSSNRTASASVGGGKSSNPASKTGSAGSGLSGSKTSTVGVGPASKAVDSFTKSISGFTDAVARGLNQIGQNVTNMSNAAASSIVGGKKASEESEKGFAAVSLGGLTGNARVVANELASAGWTQPQIAGALGRLSVESDLNPEARRKKDNKKYTGELADSVGIGQWNGPRQQALKDFAAEKGKSWKDLATQAQFLDHEMRTVEKKAWNAMKSATTQEEAAVAMMHYERPYGYKPNNPTAGLHWSKTVNRTNGYGTSLGGEDNGEAVASASVTPAKANADFSVGGLISSIFGGSNAVSSESSPVETAYRDPYVTKVDAPGVKAVSKVTENDPDDPRNRPRLGLGKLAEDAKGKKPVEVVKGIAGAIRDPVGFVLNSIEDGWNQNGGLAGLKSDFANADWNPFDGNTPTGRHGEYLSPLADTRAGNGGQGSSKSGSTSSDSTAMAAVTPLTPKERTPFWWSNLLGSTTIS